MGLVTRCDPCGKIAESVAPKGWLHVQVESAGGGNGLGVSAVVCSAACLAKWSKSASKELARQTEGRAAQEHQALAALAADQAAA